MQTGIKCPYIGCEKLRFDSMYFVLFTLPINTEIRFALTDCDRNLRPQQMSTTTHEKVACTKDECCVACLSPSLSPTTRRPGVRSIRQAELSGGHQLQASLYAAFFFFFDFQICSRVGFFFLPVNATHPHFLLQFSAVKEHKRRSTQQQQQQRLIDKWL